MAFYKLLKPDAVGLFVNPTVNIHLLGQIKFIFIFKVNKMSFYEPKLT